MNAKLRLLTVLSFAILMSACGKDGNGTAASPAAPETSLSSAPESESDSKLLPPIIPFDINAIPVTDKNIGEFPFIKPPQGYRYVTDTLTTVDESISLRDPHLHYYPIGSDRLHTVEGKILKVMLYNEKQKSSNDPNFDLIHQYYEKAITAAGGVKVFDSEAKSGKNYNFGSPTPENSGPKLIPTIIQQRAYVIHRKDKEVWFELDCVVSGCALIVAQKEKT